MQKNLFSYLPSIYPTKKYRVGVQQTNIFFKDALNCVSTSFSLEHFDICQGGVGWIDMEKVICAVISAIENMHHAPHMQTSSFYHMYQSSR